MDWLRNPRLRWLRSMWLAVGLGLVAGCFEAVQIVAMLRLDLTHMIAEIWPVWFPMLIGSVPMMAVVWLTFYFPVRAMVQVRQNRRRQHLAQRLAARQAYADSIEAQGDPSI